MRISTCRRHTYYNIICNMEENKNYANLKQFDISSSDFTTFMNLLRPSKL